MSKMSSGVGIAIGMAMAMGASNINNFRTYKPLKQRTSSRVNKPTNRRKKVKLARKAKLRK